MSMQLNDFDFTLPTKLIARYPLPQRSASRLLCLEGKGEVTHRYFSSIIDLINPGDLLVFNDTKVIPARLYGQKATGGKVEVLVERIIDQSRMLAQIKASKAPRVGDHLLFPKYVCLEILDRQHQFYELQYNHTDRTMLEIVESIGHIPIPPYLQRLPDETDKERYQTIYAKHKGSVAAPTAGLHFDEHLIQKLRDKQVNMSYLTLHIGAGTFLPIRVSNIHEHTIHSEYLMVSDALCQQIYETKSCGKRVIAVGTTSMRALETASQSGCIEPYRGETNIFIYPSYQFQCADALITNLHLPCSSLLMLVCAFGGYEPVMRAYREAVSQDYRFYSYGDAMWVSK